MSKNAFQSFFRLLNRFRYPVSLPEDIAKALGISLSNFLSFDKFIEKITDPSLTPARLMKFMPREQAEAAFESACRKEIFPQKTLISYYFNQGWLEFILQFDEESRLRRIYVQHKKIASQEGTEIPLKHYNPLIDLDLKASS